MYGDERASRWEPATRSAYHRSRGAVHARGDPAWRIRLFPERVQSSQRIGGRQDSRGLAGEHRGGGVGAHRPIRSESSAGYLARDEAAERTLTTLRFFWRSKQGPEPDATGYKGFYYHFLDMQTGARAWQCELSTVDSALLLGGMLTAAAYFDGDAPAEREIRDLAERLYARVDWRWAQNGGATVTHGWRPESGFLPYRWQGYDEALLLYVLGLGSPTYPLSAESYPAWASTYRVEDRLRHPISSTRGRCSPTSSPTCGLIFAASRTPSCASAESTTSRTAAAPRSCSSSTPSAILAATPATAKLCWGITASDGPGDVTRQIEGVERRFFDYLARAVPDGPDDGTIAPWAVVASLPFAPEIVLPTHFALPAASPRRPPPLRFQGDVQPNLSCSGRFPARLGFAVALRPQPGADRRDDRELPSRDWYGV